jgi:predicted transcriptional regulator
MESLCDLLFEVSNEDRLRILKKIRDSPSSISSLAKDLSLSSQEASRHAHRLTEVGLTRRDPDSLFRATEYGKLILQQLQGPTFISKHREYFTAHTLPIPDAFIARIGELNEATNVDDIVLGIFKMENVVREAEEYVLTMASQYPVSSYPLFFDAWERGVRVNSVDAKLHVPPEQILEVIGQEEWRGRIHRARADGLSEDRLIDVVEVNLWMSEKEVGLLAFPKADGTPDLLGFSSTDQRAHLWCRDLFDHYWERGEQGHWDEIHLYPGEEC